MFSTPSSRATTTQPSDGQLQFSIAHLVVREAMFLCTWSPAGPGCDQSGGAFLCSKDELIRFLMTPDLPKMVALQVLIPSSPFGWSLRNALTVAHRLMDGSEFGELAFGDDLELFDSWSKRLPSSMTLTPLWSAPAVEITADARLDV